MTGTIELLSLSALEARDRIRAGELTPLDLVEASIRRIEAVDIGVNAIPVRCFDRALAQARGLMERHAGAPRNYPLLAGLPLVVKDNSDVAGVPTSGGSPLTQVQMPERSDPVIARLEAHGAIPVGKSNLSELGGANTTNALFGPTRNPFDPRLTPAGSSGGSAVALATGEVLLAHGNDVGGSLRTPAGFCGVVGLRPTPGLVPRKPSADPQDTIFVEGPMARSVADTALMLDGMAGPCASDPLSYDGLADGGFLAAALRPRAPGRVAVSADLGVLPVSKENRRHFERVETLLGREQVAYDRAEPDFVGVQRATNVIRGVGYASKWKERWPAEAERFTADVRGDIERGMAASPDEVAQAQRRRTKLTSDVETFFQRYDVLICPVAQTGPFPVELPWPTEIDGKPLATYIEWIAVTYFWSMAGVPALTVSIGRDERGFPIGVQLVGPPRSERRLLAAAAWLEAIARPS
ncbi:amidase [Mesorhizobium sp. L-8-10]|uniref:amidase n=1 Tax=Mesorhizobium sp. L-8-10 TaxID=2744523 RepID=UPI001928EE85|nr:amidase [Mesorhizobium sp. L-8-10]BCH29283.1 amidase [Mesorhizobium sp. L-8-10]